MTPGIAPDRLLDQVRSTAAWALEDGTMEALARELAADWPASSAGLDHLRLLLRAHHATVATFCPTDVDARIRHHAWQAIHHAEALARAVAVVDEIAAMPAAPVSERVVLVPPFGSISGHDGEWLAVRAGALGRALELGAVDVARELEARIDGELEREAGAFRAARAAGGEVLLARCATVLAHNAGDLSRVVEAWSPAVAPAATRSRYLRLGHEGGARHGGAFVLAGAVNKAVTAVENHRFLALRRPRALRRSRELLLPIGPFFDGWGERVATHAALEHDDRVEVVGALLETLARDDRQLGPGRALAGIDRRTPGGLAHLAEDLPARQRKLPPSVIDALRTSEERFFARVAKRVAAAIREAAALTAAP